MSQKLTRESLSAERPDRQQALDGGLDLFDYPPGVFPREFESKLWEHLDRRFAVILLLTLLCQALVIALLLHNLPSQLSEKDVARIQKQFAKLVLDKTGEPEETTFVESSLPEEALSSSSAAASKSATGTGTASGRSGGQRGGGPGGGPGSGTGGGGAFGEGSRERISSAVSQAGILGLLTSSETGGGGSAAADVLGRRSVQADLDQALAGVGGLRRATSGEEGGGGGGTGTGGGHGVRGGRETGGGGIDAMVTGLGEGKARGVSRTGDLVFKNEEPLIETEEGQTSAGRSQDAVAAIVARHISAIQSCYQSEVRRNPNLKGKIVVRFVISPQGTVSSAVIVSTTLNSTRVENCVLGRIRRWDDFGAIDPQKGNTTIRQVYTFGY